MRKRGDRIIITSGKSGHSGTVEANVYQRAADYSEQYANGFQVMLDECFGVTVRGYLVEPVQ